jgi:hypothetical protein
MALTPGVITIGAVGSNTVQLLATKPSTGTGPFTYQWYRSIESGFVPGPGNAIGAPIESDEASIEYMDTTATPGTKYYYDLVATEDGPSPDTANYAPVSATTKAPTLNPNQFGLQPYLGMLDQSFNTNSISVMIDASQLTGITPGTPLKIVSSVGGVPKVAACTSNTDKVAGYLNYNIKDAVFTAGMPATMSADMNVMYLYATGAITRGEQVCCEVATVGGVSQATGSSGKRIVGWAFDAAAGEGKLIRIMLKTPTFALDS